VTRIRVWHFAGTINRHDFIDTVVRYLDRERFEVGVVTFLRESNIESPQYEEVGIPHRVIPVSSYRAYGAYLRAAWRLAQMLRQEGVEILHAHHYWEGFVAALAKKLYPRVQLVLHRHYTEDVLRLPPLKRRVLLGLERWMYKQADRLVVPTDFMARLVRQLHSKVGHIEVIPYGFAFSAEKYQRPSEERRQAVRSQYGASDGHFVIVNVATHRLQKGQHVLLRAFQKFYGVVPQGRLWLVGEGPETPMLKALAEELGLLQGGLEAPCRFLGWRRGLEVRDLIAASDLFVHPTFSEAFPQVMVESLSLGVPLVITPVSGAVDYLRHGETAWLVPREDVAALAEALLYLYQHPDLRLAIAQRGQAFVRESFDYTQVNRKYEQLYASLV
jgi:glycosyltransferase involved in cell wall biosynthesis